MYTDIPVTQVDGRSIHGHLVPTEAGLGCFLHACWFFSGSRWIQDNDLQALLLAFYKTACFYHLQNVSDLLGSQCLWFGGHRYPWLGENRSCKLKIKQTNNLYVGLCLTAKTASYGSITAQQLKWNEAEDCSILRSLFIGGIRGLKGILKHKGGNCSTGFPNTLFSCLIKL